MPTDSIHRLFATDTPPKLTVSALLFTHKAAFDEANRVNLTAITIGADLSGPKIRTEAFVYIATHGVLGFVPLVLAYSGPGREGMLIQTWDFSHMGQRIDELCQRFVQLPLVVDGYGTYWFRVLQGDAVIAETPVIFQPRPELR